MAMCVNKSSAEFKRLSRLSGLSDEALALSIMVSQEMYDRYPELDELPFCDSSSEIVERYGLEDKGTVMVGDANNILAGTDEKTFVNNLNNTYKDYDTSSMIIDGRLLLYPVKRSSIGTSDYNEKYTVDKEVDTGKNTAIIRAIAERMDKLYGIKFKLFRNSDIDNYPELSGVNAASRNAFILGGEIYINLDNASIDAPIHEMMHMMLGELKFNNPKLYNELVESITAIPNYRYNREKFFPNMMEHDAMEELFVMHAARYMAGLDNIIDKLPKKERSLIDYSILRMINSTVMGNNSSMGYNINSFKGKSILDMCEMLGSTLSNSKQSTSDMGFKARVMMNEKIKLAQQGILTENCI